MVGWKKRSLFSGSTERDEGGISSPQVDWPDEVQAPRVVQTAAYVHVGGAAAGGIRKLPSSGGTQAIPSPEMEPQDGMQVPRGAREVASECPDNASSNDVQYESKGALRDLTAPRHPHVHEKKHRRVTARRSRSTSSPLWVTRCCQAGFKPIP